MSPDDLKRAYEAFFFKSEAGKAFMQEVSRLIGDFHDKAERDPEHSRDFMQNARGTRAVKEHIDIVTTKAGKPMKK